MTRWTFFLLCFVAAQTIHATQPPFWVQDEAVNQNLEDIFSKDSQNVKLSGEQTITGTKKFSQIGTSGDPVNQVYVDSITLTNAGGLSVNGNSFRYVPWTGYTPTFSAGWGTVTGIDFVYRIVGDTMEIYGYWTLGTVAASEGSITLPSGWIIDSSIVVGQGYALGNVWQLDDSGNTLYSTAFTGQVAYFQAGTTDRLFVTERGQAKVFDPQNINASWTSNNGGSI